MTETIQISQLKKSLGAEAFIQGVVSDFETAETKSGKPFVKFNLSDATGSAACKIWDTDEEINNSEVIGVKAKVDDFGGTLQLIVSKFKVVEGAKPSDFARRSSFSPEFLDDQIGDAIESVRGELGEVVRYIFRQPGVLDTFLIAPAAITNHHAFDGGLAEHTLSMLELASVVCDHYDTFYSDMNIDRHLVYAGVLLHDLGKIYDYKRDGITWVPTIESELVGHIPAVTMLISEACDSCGVSQDTRNRLLHVVLSHHGKLEYGSPVVPKFIEAQIVHSLDMLDSRFAMFREATKDIEEGEVTGWVRPLGSRVVK